MGTTMDAVRSVVKHLTEAISPVPVRLVTHRRTDAGSDLLKVNCVNVQMQNDKVDASARVLERKTSQIGIYILHNEMDTAVQWKDSVEVALKAGKCKLYTGFPNPVVVPAKVVWWDAAEAIDFYRTGEDTAEWLFTEFDVHYRT